MDIETYYEQKSLKEKKRLLYGMRERQIAHTFHWQQNKDFTIEYNPYDGYDLFDITVWSAGTKSIVELKTRSRTSWQDTETMVEIYKWNNVINEAKKANGVPFFWIIFEDNVIALFDLTKTTPSIGYKERPDHSTIESETLTEDPHYLLPIRQATLYQFPYAPTKYKTYNCWAEKELNRRFREQDVDFTDVYLKGKF